MTGLEKIIDQILADANTQANDITAEANAQAEQILSEAKQESERITADIQKKSASDVENHKKRVQSANDLHRRMETLKSKQTVIAKVIDAAYEKVCSLDTASYFGMLEKMIQKYALAQAGEIYFSAKDLSRMPEGFENKIEAAAKSAGGSLTLSRTGKDIENGFILVYGGMEENCTLRALFDARRDEMQDTVHALLYGKEA
jgi:V/A-type H+-transporting ATPase subunit E